MGSAALFPTGNGNVLTGEVWVPLSGPADFQIEIEVGKKRVTRTRVRVVPARRWTLYLLSSNRTDISATDLQERSLETHGANLDAAVARLRHAPDIPLDRRVRLPGTLVRADPLRTGGRRVGASDSRRENRLSGLVREPAHGAAQDHETYARLVWPAGQLARERGSH